VIALRLNAWKSEPVLVEVPDPVPADGEVVVRVGGAGICHSDLHLMHDFDDTVVSWRPPFTLGHETTGWVHSVGRGVTEVGVGDAVAVYGAWGCGACARCRVGLENYCSDTRSAPVPGGGPGLGLDGGIAELLLVPAARHLVPIPDGVDVVAAACLTDAGLTSYHAVSRSLPKLLPGSFAVVIGAGGLGHLAVQALRALTAVEIIAVDSRPEALRLAAESGAHVTLAAGDHVVSAIRDATRGRGADVVLDFVGNDATLAIAAAVARQLGDITLCGIGAGSLPFSFFSTRREVSLQTTYWGSRPELIEVLELARTGQLRPRTTTFELADALRAYDSLSAGEIDGRGVIVPP
jgi:propanol-preferring alcohol dehydrogenase